MTVFTRMHWIEQPPQTVTQTDRWDGDTPVRTTRTITPVLGIRMCGCNALITPRGRTYQYTMLEWRGRGGAGELLTLETAKQRAQDKHREQCRTDRLVQEIGDAHRTRPGAGRLPEEAELPVPLYEITWWAGGCTERYPLDRWTAEVNRLERAYPAWMHKASTPDGRYALMTVVFVNLRGEIEATAAVTRERDRGCDRCGSTSLGACPRERTDAVGRL